MNLIHIALGIGLAAAGARAYEINGRVFAEEDGRTLPGAVIRVLGRGDSVVADSSGAYRIRFDLSGLRPPGSPRAAAPARIRAGALEYQAAGRASPFTGIRRIA